MVTCNSIWAMRERIVLIHLLDRMYSRFHNFNWRTADPEEFFKLNWTEEEKKKYVKWAIKFIRRKLGYSKKRAKLELDAIMSRWAPEVIKNEKG